MAAASAMVAAAAAIASSGVREHEMRPSAVVPFINGFIPFF
jgi:hypothetical protein